MDKPGFDVHADIPGTTVFDGRMAMKGYALNKMCYSFNDQSARDAFAADEEGYMTRFALTDEHKAAIRARDILAMIEAGGQYLLPRQTRGHLQAFGSGCRGHANGHDDRRIQVTPEVTGIKV